MRRKLLLFLTIILVAMSAVGAGTTISILNNSNNNNNMDITINGKDSIISSDFTLKGIYPSQSKDCTIKFSDELPKGTTLYLSFVKNGTTTLAPFIDVNISYNNNKQQCDKLSNYLNDKIITLTVEGKEPIIISYSMPNNIGNEAQKTIAIFTLKIEVKNEGK